MFPFDQIRCPWGRAFDQKNASFKFKSPAFTWPPPPPHVTLIGALVNKKLMYVLNFSSQAERQVSDVTSEGVVYTAISRKVVGKTARDNPQRHCGWF